MMTESEAWEWLANLWKTAHRARPTTTDVVVWTPSSGGNTTTYFGLCSCIRYGLTGLVSVDVAISMDARIGEEGKRLRIDKDDYFWPTNEQGAKARVEFCERMAEATKPKEGVANEEARTT